jgi:hypothetical protein
MGQFTSWACFWAIRRGFEHRAQGLTAVPDIAMARWNKPEEKCDLFSNTRGIKQTAYKDKEKKIILKWTSKNKLRGLSPRANYTDKATAAGRQS